MPRKTPPFTPEQTAVIEQARQAAEARRAAVRELRRLSLEANDLGVSVRRLADATGHKPTTIFNFIALARQERDEPDAGTVEQRS